MLDFVLDVNLETRLTALSDKKQRSKLFITKEALKRYIEQEESKQDNFIQVEDITDVERASR